MIDGVPYTPPMIAKVLRDMPAERLATIEPATFQAWPTKQIVKRNIIVDLIDAERAARRIAA